MSGQIEIGWILGAYAFLGSASFGYLFLRSGWPKVRSIDTSYKIGWAVLIGAAFSIIVSVLAFALQEFAGIRNAFIPVLAISAAATHIALFARRKTIGPKKVDVVVTKKAFASEVVASPITGEKRSRLELFLEKKREREEKAAEAIALEQAQKKKTTPAPQPAKPAPLQTTQSTLDAEAAEKKSVSKAAKEKIFATRPLAAAPEKKAGAQAKPSKGLAEKLKKGFSELFAKKPKAEKSPATPAAKPAEAPQEKRQKPEAREKKPLFGFPSKREQNSTVDVKALDREWEKLRKKDNESADRPQRETGKAKELLSLKKIIAQPQRESVTERPGERRQEEETQKPEAEKAAQAKQAVAAAPKPAPAREHRPLFGFLKKPEANKTVPRQAPATAQQEPMAPTVAMQKPVDRRAEREKKDEIRRIIDAMKTLKQNGSETENKKPETAMQGGSAPKVSETSIPRRLQRRHGFFGGNSGRGQGAASDEREIEKDLEPQMGVEGKRDTMRREKDIESQIIREKAKTEIGRFRERENREPTKRELGEIADNIFSQLEKSRLRGEPEEGKGVEGIPEQDALEGPAKPMTRRQRARQRKQYEGEDAEELGTESGDAQLPEGEDAIDIPEQDENVESIGLEEEKGEDEFDLSDLSLGKDEELRISELDDGTGFKKTVETDKNTCPNCKSKAEALVFCSGCGTAYCPHCAKKMEKLPDGMIKYTCPQCGTEVRARA